MATKTDKKNAIRQAIIDSAGIYSHDLAGKAFLFVYGEEFFEICTFNDMYYVSFPDCSFSK